MYKSDSIGSRTLFDQLMLSEQESEAETIVNTGDSSLNAGTKEQKEDTFRGNDMIDKHEDVYKSEKRELKHKIEKIVIFYSDNTFKDYSAMSNSQL